MYDIQIKILHPWAKVTDVPTGTDSVMVLRHNSVLVHGH